MEQEVYMKNGVVYGECTVAQIAKMYVDGLAARDLVLDGNTIKFSTYVHQYWEGPDDAVQSYIATYTLTGDETAFDFMNELLREVAALSEIRGRRGMYDEVKLSLDKIKVE